MRCRTSVPFPAEKFVRSSTNTCSLSCTKSLLTRRYWTLTTRTAGKAVLPGADRQWRWYEAGGFCNHPDPGQTESHSYRQRQRHRHECRRAGKQFGYHCILRQSALPGSSRSGGYRNRHHRSVRCTIIRTEHRKNHESHEKTAACKKQTAVLLVACSAEKDITEFSQKPFVKDFFGLFYSSQPAPTRRTPR